MSLQLVLDDRASIVSVLLRDTVSATDVRQWKDGLRSLLAGVAQGGHYALLIEFNGALFEDSEAHRLWVASFLDYGQFLSQCERVALIGGHTAGFELEKQLMDVAEVRFFTDGQEARQWLASMQPSPIETT